MATSIVQTYWTPTPTGFASMKVGVLTDDLRGVPLVAGETERLAERDPVLTSADLPTAT